MWGTRGGDIKKERTKRKVLRLGRALVRPVLAQDDNGEIWMSCTRDASALKGLSMTPSLARTAGGGCPHDDNSQTQTAAAVGGASSRA